MGLTQQIDIANTQQSLLELLEGAPSVALPPAQQTQLAMLVEVLMREIAMTLANATLAAREVGDDEDHR
jgi:hypothetical protein